MRDIALNLFWANRFAMTLYDKRPTRWADVPRKRDDVFLPVLEPWEDGEPKVAAVQEAYPTLPAEWDADVEDRIFGVLFDVFGNRKNHATTLPAGQADGRRDPAEPGNLTFRLPRYDPDYPVYDYNDILDCGEDVPELEALHRWAMVLHNQYPWDRYGAELVEAGQLPTTTTWSPSTRATARCGTSCAGWPPGRTRRATLAPAPGGRPAGPALSRRSTCGRSSR